MCESATTRDEKRTVKAGMECLHTRPAAPPQACAQFCSTAAGRTASKSTMQASSASCVRSPARDQHAEQIGSARPPRTGRASAFKMRPVHPCSAHTILGVRAAACVRVCRGAPDPFWCGGIASSGACPSLFCAARGRGPLPSPLRCPNRDACCRSGFDPLRSMLCPLHRRSCTPVLRMPTTPCP